MARTDKATGRFDTREELEAFVIADPRASKAVAADAEVGYTTAQAIRREAAKKPKVKINDVWKVRP